MSNRPISTTPERSPPAIGNTTPIIDDSLFIPDVQIAHDFSKDYRTVVTIVAKDTTGESEAATFLVRTLPQHMGCYADRVNQPLQAELELRFTVNLPAFIAFATYVQEAKITSPPRAEPFTPLLDRLELAYRLKSETFMKKTLELLIETVKNAGRIPRHAFAQRIYHITHASASLRRLMVDMIVWDGEYGYISKVAGPTALQNDVSAGFERKAAGRVKKAPWKDASAYLQKTSTIVIKSEDVGNVSPAKKRKRAAVMEASGESAMNVVDVVFGNMPVDLTDE